MTTTVRQTILTARVANQLVANRISASCTYDLGQRTATAEIVVPTVPSAATQWAPVTLDMGGTRAGLARRFTGYLLDFDYTLWPRAVKLVCYGTLIYAEMTRNSNSGGTDLSLAGVGQTDQAMVTSVLASCGVNNVNIGGTGTVLGTIAKTDGFTWGEAESALSFIGKLDDVSLGYRTFDLPGGTVARAKVLVSPIPASPIASFTEGVDIFSGDDQQTVQEIANRVLVTGYDAGSGAVSTTVQQANPAVPAVIGHITQRIESTMIERALAADAGAGFSCQDVGTWQLGQLNHILFKQSFVTPRDDQIAPGMTISIATTGGRLGVPISGKNFWVQAVKTEIAEDGGFSQTLTCVGGIGNTAPITLPPRADFSIVVEEESVVISGAVQTLYTVFCDASASVGIQSAIATYAWTASGAANPTTGSEKTFLTTYASDPTGQTISLTVTDANGNTDTLTVQIRDVTPAAADVTRELILAATTVAEDFDGAAYRHQADPTAQGVTACTNDDFWCAGTDLLSTEDNLQTAPTAIDPFAASGDTNTCVWSEPDVDSNNVVAGSSGGRVAYSTDHGASWTVQGRVSDNAQINRIAINGANPGQFFALTAGHLYQSTDYGVSWSALETALSGETFTDFSLSHSRSMVSIDGGSRFLIEMTTGTAQTFPVLSPVVSGIVSVTADIRLDRFYCVDSSARTFFTTTDGGTAMSRGADLPATSTAEPRGIWRDGDLRPLIYVAAGANGAWKSVDGFATTAGYYQLRKPGVGTSPAAAVYLQVGCNPNLNPVPAAGSGNLWLACNNMLVNRVAMGAYVQVNPTVIGLTKFVASPHGLPLIVYALAHDLTNGQSTTLFKSNDGGTTWSKLAPTGFPTGFANPLDRIDWLSCLDGDANTLFASFSDPGTQTNTGIYKSTDGGVTWSGYFLEGASNAGNYVGSHHHVGARLWLGMVNDNVGGHSAMYINDSAGEFVFTRIGNPLGGNAFAHGIHGDAAHGFAISGSKLYYVTENADPLLPDDVTPDGLDSVASVRWVEAKSSGTTILAAQPVPNSGPHSLYRSASFGAGKSWSVVVYGDSDLNVTGQEIAIDDNAGDWWVAAGSHVWHSTDDGLSWTKEHAALIGNGAVNQVLVVE